MEIPSRPAALDQLPNACLQRIKLVGYCEIDEGDVKSLIGGEWSFRQAITKPRASGYFLNDDGAMAILCWNREKIKVTPVLASTSWKDFVGPVRNQQQHLVCWAYAASDLVSAKRILRQWENDYYHLCSRYLCRFTHPRRLGTDRKAKPGHVCYGRTIEDALKHIMKEGIPREINSNIEFDCSYPLPPNPIPRGNGEVKSIRTFDTLEAALEELQFQPICADLIVFPELQLQEESLIPTTIYVVNL